MKQKQSQAVSELSILRNDSYDPQELSDVIGDIHAAAVDRPLWTGAIGRAARFIRGTGTVLYSKDAANQVGRVRYMTGIEPSYTQLYFDKYAMLGPTTRGQPILGMMSRPELLETRLYREWMRPQGFVDVVDAVVDKTTAGVAVFTVFRSERDGVVNDDVRHRMRMIVPHIRRAVLIGRMFDLKAVEIAAYADTLDGLNFGMCLVDAKGRIIHINAAGHAIITVSDALHSVGGRLVARDARVEKTLREILVTAGQQDAVPGMMEIALPLIGKDNERYVVHVLPLTSGAHHRAGGTSAAAAALFIRRATLEMPSTLEVIGKTFKLTPTELRVLSAIVEVGGVPEVAATLGVAATTIKTHLGRLFEKTGAKRQADLVKLAAGYATPLNG